MEQALQAGPGRHRQSVSGEALARLAGKAWDAADRASLEEMKKAGIQILDARPSWSRACRTGRRASRTNGCRSATAKGVDGAKMLAEFREELKRVAAGN